MSQFKVITTNTNNVWDSKKRYKVNSVVSHNDILYQNITGKNSSPDTLVDWIVSKAVSFLCVPLSGTTTGNPVTGNIEMNSFDSGSINIRSSILVDDSSSYSEIKFKDPYSVELISNYNGLFTILSVEPESVSILSNDPLSRGISSLQDFSANITDLDYTQKIYVDGLRGKHISKTTTEINAIVTPQAGETYFNTTLSTLCFWDGSAWRKVSDSAM